MHAIAKAREGMNKARDLMVFLETIASEEDIRQEASEF